MIDVEQTPQHLWSKTNNEGSISIREILEKYIYHWPLFILGLLLSLSLAFLYLRYTKPIYQVASTLLIKDEKKSGSSENILNQLDLFDDSKVVENEIEILQSKTLMRKVVDRLHLDVNYQTEGRVINSDIYEKRPINFVTIKMNPLYYSKDLLLSITGPANYTLEDINSGEKINGTINQLQKNSFGVYKVELTAFFSNDKARSINLSFNDPQQIADECLSNLTVNIRNKQSTVLELSYLATVPLRGQDILNTLVEVYNEASLADKNRTTQSTIQFIDERLKLITGELTDVEKDVENFKSNNGLTDISSSSELFLENVKSNDAQLSEVNIKLGVINDIKRYINSDSPQEKLPSTMGIEDPVLLGKITQLSDLQLQREKLLATTQRNNPLVEPIARQIETTRAGIQSNVQNIESALLTTKKTIEANNSLYQGLIKKIPGQERQFISIKRQQTIKETLYLYLLQKKEEAALSYASSIADSRIVDAAFYKKTPINPKKRIVFLAALLSGLLLPIGYIYSKDLLNNKVMRSSDISKLTNVPILGEIIYEEGVEPIVVSENSRKAIAEQFRAIRTNLQFIYGKTNTGNGHVTLFTSTMSGEGKSFVASNVAAALAISGRKTIILELDLRKPKISRYLKLTNKAGLSNYLIGKAEINEIIANSGINENLFVIGSGPIPPNPSELLIQNGIEELVNYLRSNFDEIIIDTPPIGLVTDAQILARLADATIYLLRQGQTYKQQLNQLENLYQDKKLPRLNVILNGVQLEGQYSYGYGYGYGYYSDDQDRKGQGIRSTFKNFYKRF